MDDKKENQTNFTEAANRINLLLWIERRKFNTAQINNPEAIRSSLHMILQDIWSTICQTTGNDLADEAYVDGTIYKVCNEYEKVITLINDMRSIVTPVAYNIVSGQLAEYMKAISHCRYNIMSDKGRFRFGYVFLGEK